MINQLLSPSFLFNPRPDYYQASFVPALVVFGLVFLVGVSLSFIQKLANRSWRDPLAQWFRWLGFSGLLLLVSRNQQLPILAMPFLWVLVVIGFLLWLGYIWRELKRHTPNLEEQTKRYHTFEKYLPRPKKAR